MSTEKKITVKRENLFSFRFGLTLLNGVPGVRLGAFRAKLSRAIEAEIKDMESFKETEEWQRIDKMLDSINLKYATKKHGDALIKNRRYIYTPEDSKKRDEEVDKMMESESKAFDERRRLLEEYKNMLGEEAEFNLPTIALSDIPDSVNSEVIEILWPVIIEDETTPVE